MQIEIKAQRENPTLDRQEVEFVLHHPGEPTPQRSQVQELVASKTGGDASNVIVDNMKSEFGRGATQGYAKVYETKEAALHAEPEHLLIRNGLVEAA